MSNQPRIFGGFPGEMIALVALHLEDEATVRQFRQAGTLTDNAAFDEFTDRTCTELVLRLDFESLRTTYLGTSRLNLGRVVKRIKLQSRHNQPNSTPLRDRISILLVTSILRRCHRATEIDFEHVNAPGQTTSQPSPALTPQLLAAITPLLPALERVIVGDVAIDGRALADFLIAHAGTVTFIGTGRVNVTSTVGGPQQGPQQGWRDLLDEIRNHMAAVIYLNVMWPQIGAQGAGLPIVPIQQGIQGRTTYVVGDMYSDVREWYRVHPNFMTFNGHQATIMGIRKYLGF